MYQVGTGSLVVQAQSFQCRGCWSHPWLRNYDLTCQVLEESMATHSSILTWRIPRTEEPGGLQSMGSHRVGRD